MRKWSKGDVYQAYLAKEETKQKRKEARDRFKAKHPHRMNQLSYDHDKRNPVKRHARVRLREALKRNLLIRPDRCSVCDVGCTPHGHHEDYSKPLEVIWVCPQCHSNIHKTKQNKPGSGS